MKQGITVFILMNLQTSKGMKLIEKLYDLDEVKEIYSVHGDENLAKAYAIQGKELKQNLMKIAVRSKDIKEVRGKCLFIGIEVKHGNAMMFCRKLLELGIIVNDCHGHTIRISPPLNISESEIGFLFECLEKVFLK